MWFQLRLPDPVNQRLNFLETRHLGTYKTYKTPLEVEISDMAAKAIDKLDNDEGRR